jgi:polysaccharide pyruvyl transferase WcaK-like protein
MCKPCLAYAVDVGNVSPFNRRLVRRVASKTDPIITRTRAAAECLRSWGVSAPLDVTADTALTFRVDPADERLVERTWPEAASGVVGLSVEDFTLWPVVLRPWGRPDYCYKWPYYFSHSPERSSAREDLARGYAALADRLVAQHDRSIALICMEELDEPLAKDVLQRMTHAGRARIFSSRAYNASQMTVLLRSLDLLVASRYHASVLALAAQVPQVAVGHDLRLRTLYQELGLDAFFIEHRSPALWDRLTEHVERLLADPASVQDALQRGYIDLLGRARRNRELLQAFAAARGWRGEVPWAA